MEKFRQGGAPPVLPHTGEAPPTLPLHPHQGKRAGAVLFLVKVVFHLLLQAHHIRMVPEYQLYDWGYTAIGVALVAAGVALARPAR